MRVNFIEDFFIVILKAQVKNLFMEVQRRVSHDRLAGEYFVGFDAKLFNEQRQGACVFDG
jgi:hypothetical protein